LKILPIRVMYNPTVKWMKTVYRYQDDHKDPPRYSSAIIEAVLMTGDIDLAVPNTESAIEYEMIKWPNDTTVLRVFELEDGSLWELLTDNSPISVYPGQSNIRGKEWRDDTILSWAARKCSETIGDDIKMLYLVRRLSEAGLALHNSRLVSK
jgi:hypothetical protein